MLCMRWQPSSWQMRTWVRKTSNPTCARLDLPSLASIANHLHSIRNLHVMNMCPDALRPSQLLILYQTVKLRHSYSLNKALYPAGVCDSSPVSGRCEQADAAGAQASQLCDTHQLPGNSPGLQVHRMHADATDILPTEAAYPDLRFRVVTLGTALQAICFHT